MRLLAPFGAALLLAGCGARTESQDVLQTRTITLPDGSTIVAETLSNAVDMARGMMFRDSLAPDRGMLFLHPQAGAYPYWMYQVRIPLDLIWMNRDGVIVELVASAPPCPGPASECPNYGGSVPASMVLELAGGQAARHGLKLGDRLRVQ